MRRLALAALLFLGLAPAAGADCTGADLMAALPPDRQAAIIAAADSVPFARGNLWLATRGAQSLTIAGTYHLDDPRHAGTLAVLAPRLDGAQALLVEAGPEEEARLMKALGNDPSRMFITTGPSLLERLPPETWDRLVTALEARGVPGILGAKFQPWYASIVLAIPACALAETNQPKGLDGALVAAAQDRGLPVVALEPWDTIFALFDSFTPEQEIDMLESALAMEGQSADFSSTLADAYFRGESRLIWELTREYSARQPGQSRASVDAELALMEEVMMARRNRAWIPVIEAAAARGPAVVAFGALHLSGEAGVLNLLAQNGWQVQPLAP